MKILIATPFLYPATEYGGAARAAYFLASALQESGHTVTVVTTDVWDAANRYQGSANHSSLEVVRLKNISNHLAYHYQFYTPISAAQRVQKLLATAEIAHLHTYRNLLNDVVARLAYKSRIPFIVSGHGTIPIIERFHTAKRIYDGMIGNWQLERASGFVAVSEAERSRMKEFGLPANKIRTIPNGVEPLELPPEGRFRRRWDIGPDEKLVLFLGKITPRKGLQHLVEAFSRIRDRARLVIAGNDMGYGPEVDRKIAQLGIENRIIRAGFLNDTEKLEALRDAHLTVYPSVHEVFGLVALESLLCGTPVIVGDDDGAAEIIRKTGGADVVSWGNIDQLVAAITKHLDRPKNVEELSGARDFILDHYNWKMVASQTANFYQDCLKP